MNTFKKFFQRGNNGFPKFKKRSSGDLRFGFGSQASGSRYRQTDEAHIRFSGFENLRIKPEILHSKLHGELNFNYDGKYWYFNYVYEVPEEENTNTTVVGVDLGIKDLAITSDGDVFGNINYTAEVRRLEKKLKRLQRQVSRKYEMNKQGNKFIKTKNIIKLEKQIALVHRRLKNIRNTYNHTVTAALTKAKPGTIVIEDLNVRGMMKNKHLAKAIIHQGLYSVRFMLEYKCKLRGINLVYADRFYPSSKTCSNCGEVKKDLKLSERTYHCEHCGFTLDRDLNAAINLKNLAYA